MSGIGGSEDEPMNPNLLDPVLRGSLEREPAGPDDHASQQKGSANTEHARFSWLSQSDRQMTTREDLHRSDPQDKLDFVLDGLPDATSKLLSDIAQQTVPQCCEFPHTTFPYLGDPFQAWPFRDGVDCSKVRMEFFKMVREVRFILVRTGRGDIPLEEWFPPSGCPLTSSLCFESTYPSTKRSNNPALQFMFAAYTGDLDESIFFFDRWPIVTPTAGRFAKHADAVRRWGEQVVSRNDQFTAWCRSTCVAPVSIVAGSELQKDMIASAVEFVAIAEVSSIRTSEEFPVNLAILQHLDRYQLGVPLPHGQKWSFNLTQQADEKIALDFVLDVAHAITKRTRRFTVVDATDVVIRANNWLRAGLMLRSPSYGDALDRLGGLESTEVARSDTVSNAIRRVAQEHQDSASQASTVALTPDESTASTASTGSTPTSSTTGNAGTTGDTGSSTVQ